MQVPLSSYILQAGPVTSETIIVGIKHSIDAKADLLGSILDSSIWKNGVVKQIMDYYTSTSNTHNSINSNNNSINSNKYSNHDNNNNDSDSYRNKTRKPNNQQIKHVDMIEIYEKWSKSYSIQVLPRLVEIMNNLNSDVTALEGTCVSIATLQRTKIVEVLKGKVYVCGVA